MTLPQELLSTLNNQGFCSHALSRIVEQCSAALDTMADDSGVRYVMVYLIRDACYRIAEHLNATAPVTADRHARIEALVRVPLEAAISASGEDTTCAEAIPKVSTLLRATKDAMTTRNDP